MIINILDIDLDFFLDNKDTRWFDNSTSRLDSNRFHPWSTETVERFLEENCGLNKSNKISGKYCIHHDEVFYALRQLQEKAKFSLKFSIDHIDAHADLGLGDSSYAYIATSLLNKPVADRAYPEELKGMEALSPGNFLSFAVACQWVERLRYINKIQWASDAFWFNFKDFEPKSNVIQLKQFNEDQMDYIINKGSGDMKENAKLLKPLRYEPKVPFETIDFNAFRSNQEYDFMFLTQSPGYTPKTSDNLIPIIQQYMDIQEELDIPQLNS